MRNKGREREWEKERERKSIVHVCTRMYTWNTDKREKQDQQRGPVLITRLPSAGY